MLSRVAEAAAGRKARPRSCCELAYIIAVVETEAHCEYHAARQDSAMNLALILRIGGCRNDGIEFLRGLKLRTRRRAAQCLRTPRRYSKAIENNNCTMSGSIYCGLQLGKVLDKLSFLPHTLNIHLAPWLSISRQLIQPAPLCFLL
jgi:hypothetical protein